MATVLVASRQHMVTISSAGVKDKEGNALTENYSWTFTTGTIVNVAGKRVVRQANPLYQPVLVC